MDFDENITTDTAVSKKKFGTPLIVGIIVLVIALGLIIGFIVVKNMKPSYLKVEGNAIMRAASQILEYDSKYKETEGAANVQYGIELLDGFFEAVGMPSPGKLKPTVLDMDVCVNPEQVFITATWGKDNPRIDVWQQDGSVIMSLPDISPYYLTMSGEQYAMNVSTDNRLDLAAAYDSIKPAIDAYLELTKQVKPEEVVLTLESGNTVETYKYVLEITTEELRDIFLLAFEGIRENENLMSYLAIYNPDAEREIDDIIKELQTDTSTDDTLTMEVYGDANTIIKREITLHSKNGDITINWEHLAADANNGHFEQLLTLTDPNKTGFEFNNSGTKNDTTYTGTANLIYKGDRDNFGFEVSYDLIIEDENVSGTYNIEFTAAALNFDMGGVVNFSDAAGDMSMEMSMDGKSLMKLTFAAKTVDTWEITTPMVNDSNSIDVTPDSTGNLPNTASMSEFEASITEFAMEYVQIVLDRPEDEMDLVDYLIKTSFEYALNEVGNYEYTPEVTSEPTSEDDDTSEFDQYINPDGSIDYNALIMSDLEYFNSYEELEEYYKQTYGEMLGEVDWSLFTDAEGKVDWNAFFGAYLE